MIHVLPSLPYQMNELEPYLSKETIEYHYGKHHQAYINNLNNLIPGTEFASLALEDIIKQSSGTIFNNAAQIYNHNFYWQCLTKTHNQHPQKELLNAINNTWGDFNEFKKQFIQCGLSTFGSGWAWLVKTPKNTLEIISTSNGITPITTDNKPLLVCDVWEHAYYIDYRNNRANYLEMFFKIINWEFALENFLK